MVTIDLHVDEETLARARVAAHARRQTLEEIVTRVVADLGKATGPSAPSTENGIIGLFADEPELMDKIVEEAMRLREARWARYHDEQSRH